MEPDVPALRPEAERSLRRRDLRRRLRRVGARGAGAAEHPVRLRGRDENNLYCREHLGFTVLSDYTYNRVGYVDTDIDDLDALQLGEPLASKRDETEKLERAAALQAEHGITDLVLGLDHMATRILAGDRESALLEYLTMVPYYFWGAYNIVEMNSSTT